MLWHCWLGGRKGMIYSILLWRIVKCKCFIILFSKTTIVLSFAAQSKPKIQRIVWEDDRNAGVSATQSSGSMAQGTLIPLIAGSTEHLHHVHRGGGGQTRGFSRTPMQVYRGQQRQAARPMMQQSVMRQRTPGLPGPRQVARRARGRSPGAQRQQFY